MRPFCLSKGIKLTAKLPEAIRQQRHKARCHRYYEQHKVALLEQMRQYYAAHKEEKIAQVHQYREIHKEDVAASLQRYNEAHKDEIKAGKQQYYQEHKTEVNQHNMDNYYKDREKRLAYFRSPEFQARKRASYARHRAERLEARREYSRLHPEKDLEHCRQRRGRKRGAFGSFTSLEFGLLCMANNYKCVYCGKEEPLVPDHAIPLARGGSNCIGNIVPTCERCNTAKHTLTYGEFMDRLKKDRDAKLAENRVHCS